jgi:hypothetical protein
MLPDTMPHAAMGAPSVSALAKTAWVPVISKAAKPGISPNKSRSDFNLAFFG